MDASSMYRRPPFLSFNLGVQMDFNGRDDAISLMRFLFGPYS
jgi:hypothetical protein